MEKNYLYIQRYVFPFLFTLHLPQKYAVSYVFLLNLKANPRPRSHITYALLNRIEVGTTAALTQSSGAALADKTIVG
jgi:hypothetical protein